MGSIADGAATKALDAITGRASVSSSATYLALLTSAPEPDASLGDLEEVESPGTSGYERQSITWAAPTGSPITTSNVGTVVFGPFTENLDEVTHCALVSVATGTSGNLLYFWDLDISADPANGDTITFNAGSLTISGPVSSP